MNCVICGAVESAPWHQPGYEEFQGHEFKPPSLNGPVADRARELYEEEAAPKVLDHGEDLEEHLDMLAPYPYGHNSGRRIDDMDLGRVLHRAANLAWIALDPEAEGTTDEVVSAGLAELAHALDEAGIKWTSGR